MDNNRIRKLRSNGRLLGCGDEFHHVRNTERAKKGRAKPIDCEGSPEQPLGCESIQPWRTTEKKWAL